MLDQDFSDPLCPVTDSVPYKGLLGTNLFVTPKEDYNDDEII